MSDRYIHVEIEDDIVLIDLDKETAIALNGNSRESPIL